MKTHITESAFDSERNESIQAVTQDCATCLGLDITQNTPIEIVKAVNETIVKQVFGEATAMPTDEDPDLLLGCLWGSQMVRVLGWSWVNIHVGDSLDIAVVSPSRSMAIYPFTFVSACIRKQCICTVELSFNMLSERGDDPIYPPKTYESVMDQIHHVVPPYSLEK